MEASLLFPRVVCYFGFDCDNTIFGEDSVISASVDVAVYFSVLLVQMFSDFHSYYRRALVELVALVPV